METQEVFSLKELVFLFFGIIGIGLYRILGWIMPKTYKIFFEHIKKTFTADVIIELEILKNQKFDNKDVLDKLEKLTKETHALKNNFTAILTAILTKDKDSLEIIKNFYVEKK